MNLANLGGLAVSQSPPNSLRSSTNARDKSRYPQVRRSAFAGRHNERRVRPEVRCEPKKWEVGGPYFPGRAIYAMNYDGRDGRNKLWAAVNSSFWGSYLSASTDFGKAWTEPETYGVKFPDDTETALKQIWQIVPGNSQEPQTLYCGVEPAALFRSDDAGETWSLVKGLHDHPHRPQWQPGGGGLCLHTILPDPINKERMHIAISTGGVYRTDDGGKS